MAEGDSLSAIYCYTPPPFFFKKIDTSTPLIYGWGRFAVSIHMIFKMSYDEKFYVDIFLELANLLFSEYKIGVTVT